MPALPESFGTGLLPITRGKADRFVKA